MVEDYDPLAIGVLLARCQGTLQGMLDSKILSASDELTRHLQILVEDIQKVNQRENKDIKHRHGNVYVQS